MVFYFFETFFTNTGFFTLGIEDIFRIITNCILCILPFLFFIYFQRTKKNKYLWYFLFVVSCLYYLFLSFLLIYLIITSSFFDIDFFVDNFNDAFFTVRSIFNSMEFFYAILFFIFFILSYFVSTNFLIIKKNVNRRDLKYIIIFLSFLVVLLATIQLHFKYEKGLLVDFVGTFFMKNDIVYEQYQKDYSYTFHKYMNFDPNGFTRNGDNSLPDIYFIHLESVNGDLMNKSVIPNFDNYSNENGLVFDNFYSNSIQTLRAQESILCALPPSMSGRFRYNFDTKNIICIPKILSKYNYKTLFFKSHDLKFSGTGKFMFDIGFEETHNADIMKNGDIHYTWGFREDVFYRRVYEYLQKYKDDRKFVYIAVSTTNHYPFFVYDNKYDNLPIKNPKSVSDRIKNTVYIQDQYLKVILEELKNDKREKYVFIFSDHGWPLDYHAGNIINESNGYMENFRIPFAFLYFGDKDNYFDLKNKVSKPYNELDFLKTTLDLLDIKTNNNYLGNSFYCELLKNKEKCNKKSCSMSIQPYSDKYITFFYDNKHYIYNIRKREAYYFDISTDKYEKYKNSISQAEFLEYYNICKNIIRY